MKPNLSRIMGSERQRAGVSVKHRKAQEAVENQNRGKGLLAELRKYSEIKVLIHDVDILKLPEPLRSEILAEGDRLGFTFVDGSEVKL
jgi:hypothetical protein